MDRRSFLGSSTAIFAGAMKASPPESLPEAIKDNPHIPLEYREQLLRMENERLRERLAESSELLRQSAGWLSSASSDAELSMAQAGYEYLAVHLPPGANKDFAEYQAGALKQTLANRKPHAYLHHLEWRASCYRKKNLPA